MTTSLAQHGKAVIVNGQTRYYILVEKWGRTEDAMLYMGLEDYSSGAPAHITDKGLDMEMDDPKSPWYWNFKEDSPAGLKRPEDWRRAELFFQRLLGDNGVRFEKVDQFSHIDYFFDHPLTGKPLVVEFKYDVSMRLKEDKKYAQVLTSQAQYNALQKRRGSMYLVAYPSQVVAGKGKKEFPSGNLKFCLTTTKLTEPKKAIEPKKKRKFIS